MKIKYIAVMTALGLFGLAPPNAWAATVTFTGSIYYDSNKYDIDQYTGLQIIETLTFDLTTGILKYDQNNYDGSYGGTYYNASSPLTSVSYSVLGGPSGSFSLADAYYAEADFYYPAYYGYGEQYTYGYGPQGFSESYAEGSSVSEFGSASGSGVYGHIQVDDYATDEYILADVFSVSSPVPEPSTWGLLLLGLAGLSHVSYRKTKIRPTSLPVA